MLKPRKRITKRQIKEDKFVTYYFKANEFIREYSRQIMWGVGAVVVFIFAILIYSKSQREKEQNAVAELTRSRAEFFNSDYESAVTSLTTLVENYGSTPSGKIGAYYLANAYFYLKKFDEAKTYYEKYLDVDGDEIMESAAMSGIASCLEEKGEFEEAAKKYEQTAKKFEDHFATPQNLFDAARCYMLAEKSEAAKTVLNKLIEKYSESQLKSDAEILLAELDL